MRVAAAVLVGLVLACGAGAGTQAPRLVATPSSGLLDEPLRLTMTGAKAHARVTIRATARDAGGRPWRASRIIVADRNGRAELAGGGSLLAALTPLRGTTTFLFPSRVSFEARSGARVLARTSVTRRTAAPGLATRTLTVAADGLAGRYSALPVTSGPAVLYLGGSEGGVPFKEKAELLASRGLPTLALAYFGEPGLPQELANVPLEYFESALRWLGRQPGVDPARIAIVGISRGGEAALLVGSTFPELVAGVVSYVGSSVVNPSTNRRDPAWTHNGRPVQAPESPDLGNPRPLSGLGVIKVELIDGPVLLVSGLSDLLWPSGGYAAAIVDRRRAAGLETTSLTSLSAGHAVGVAVPNMAVRALGGTRKADASLRGRAWPRVLALLRRRVS